MAFSEVRLDMGVDYGATGGPMFNTTIVALTSGYEKRNINWSKSRGRWQLGERCVNSAEKDELISFFHARQGRAHGFRFKDWSDFRATGQTIGSGDTVKTQFQLTKTYSSAGVDYVRDIIKPVNGTVVVYIDGVKQLSGWSVDITTGVITFTNPPGNGVIVTADFEFDIPVRFDTDRFDVRFDAYRESDGEALFWLSSLPVVELRV